MRKLFFIIFLVTALVISQSAVHADTDADAYSKVYVPLPYILATHPGISGNQLDLSAIAANRGVYSYVLYRLMNPDEHPPPVSETEQRARYGYDRYSDKRFEPIMMDYTIWAMDAGYLSPSGKANHLLSVKWADIQGLFTALQIKPAILQDYSIYDSDSWGFVTESEKETIGLFLAAFGRGIDTRAIERESFTVTIADMVYLAGVLTKADGINGIDDEMFLSMTGYLFYSKFEGQLNNGSILAVCYPHFMNSKNEIEIFDLKKWAKKEGYVNYEE